MNPLHPIHEALLYRVFYKDNILVDNYLCLSRNVRCSSANQVSQRLCGCRQNLVLDWLKKIFHKSLYVFMVYVVEL